jgi:hypothetical protein
MDKHYLGTSVYGFLKGGGYGLALRSTGPIALFIPTACGSRRGGACPPLGGGGLASSEGGGGFGAKIPARYMEGPIGMRSLALSGGGRWRSLLLFHRETRRRHRGPRSLKVRGSLTLPFFYPPYSPLPLANQGAAVLCPPLGGGGLAGSESGGGVGAKIPPR